MITYFAGSPILNVASVPLRGLDTTHVRDTEICCSPSLIS